MEGSFGETDMGEGEEARTPQCYTSVEAPTAEEIEAHKVSHLPFRSWCPHCVRGKAPSDPHRRQSREEKESKRIPTCSMDYFFMGSEGLSFDDPTTERDVLPMVAVYDHGSRVTFAHPCPRKGDDRHIVREVCSDLEWLGYKRIVLKSDQEPAIMALKRAISRAMPGVEILMEESPVGAHAANGAIEGAIRRVAGQVRTLKDDVEKSYGVPISTRHPLLAFAVSHAADLITRFGVGKDGRTPWELSRGKKYKRKLLPFGECCLYMLTKGTGGRAAKMDARWRPGIFVGILKRSDEVMVMTPEGIRKARSIRRLVADQQHNPELLSQVKGLPWDKDGNGAEGDISEPSTVLPAGVDARPANDVPVVDPAPVKKKSVIGRQLYITEALLRKFGFTAGCKACETTQAGYRAPGVPHTTACRERIETAMTEDPDLADKLLEVETKRLKTIPEASNQPQEQPAPENENPNKRTRGMSVDNPASSSSSESPAAAAEAASSSGSQSSGIKRTTGEPDQVDSKSLKASRIEPSVEGSASGSAPAPPKGRKRAGSDIRDIDPKFIGLLIGDVSEAWAREGSTPDPEEVEEVSALILAMNRAHVSEVYSPPRFSAEAPMRAMTPGTAYDLETGWNLLDDHEFAMARAEAAEERPALMIGSPPCTALCQLNFGLNYPRLRPEEVRRRLEEGRAHIRRAVVMYRDQLARGDLMLHEHPWGSKSWDEPEIRELMAEEGMYLVKGPMCHWGMTSEDGIGTGLVKKETGWLTNSQILAQTLQQECSNRTGKSPWHRHVHLINGRAKRAQVYPIALVRAVLKGLRKELRTRGEIGNLEYGPSPHEPLVTVNDEATAEEVGAYWDDVRGGWLDNELVKKARAEEVAEYQKYGVIEIVPRQQFNDHRDREAAEGRRVKPIDSRWSDTNKGTADQPEVRSRLCAREIKRLQEIGASAAAGEPADLFASMPPIEAVKMIFSLLASKKSSRNKRPVKVRLFDIKRAYFNAPAARENLFIEVPEELVPEGTNPADVIGILRKSMYGTRDAGANWEHELTSCMVGCGFEQGLASPNIYVHAEKDIVAVCHGDDVHALGDAEGLDHLESALRARYEVKVRATLGFESADDKRCTFLNRIVRVNEKGLEIEADPRHAQEIIKAMNVQDGKSVATPTVKEPGDQACEESPLLSREEATQFRSICMKACYLGIDRYDIQFCVKEAAREMHAPTRRGWNILKRLARYLLGHPRLIISYPKQSQPERVRMFTDSDHAGCKRTRKSTSSLALMHGRHCIRTSVATQSTIALSSPESEYYALVKGCSISLGAQSMFMDMRIPVQVEVHCDASSGISLASRRGLGRARHISTRFLWVQHKVQERAVSIHKVPGKQNPADVGTKCVTEAEMLAATQKLGMCHALAMQDGMP